MAVGMGTGRSRLDILALIALGAAAGAGAGLLAGLMGSAVGSLLFRSSTTGF